MRVLGRGEWFHEGALTGSRGYIGTVMTPMLQKAGTKSSA
jgi:hypothetical protein